jgi:ribosomal protein S18 acetylase RimI-like enzyme
MSQVLSARTITEYLMGWTRHHDLPHTTYCLVGPLFHVHFAQPFRGTTTDFYFMHASTHSTPDQVTHAITRAQRNRSHWLTIFCPAKHVQELVPIYERLGYHIRSQETLMAKALLAEKAAHHHLPTVRQSIAATCTQASASWAQAISQGISVPLTPLLEVVVWHYLLAHDGRHVAKGAWIMTPAHAAYIDEVETEATSRRRGFAQALMAQMWGCPDFVDG